MFIIDEFKITTKNYVWVTHVKQVVRFLLKSQPHLNLHPIKILHFNVINCFVGAETLLSHLTQCRG